METVQTIRDNHPARWDIELYRRGWNKAERDITDLGYTDYPTAVVIVQELLARAGNQPDTSYCDLGSAARWIAEHNIGGA